MKADSLRPGLYIALLLLTIAACQNSGRDKLNGTWRLVSVSSTTADGIVNTTPYGAKPSGLLTYTSDGFMQVIVAFDDRPSLEGDWRTAPEEQRAAAFATALSYAGKYTLKDDEVTHHIEVSSDPNRVGQKLSRTVLMRDNFLTLTTPPTTVGATSQVFSLTWRKAKH